MRVGRAQLRLLLVKVQILGVVQALHLARILVVLVVLVIARARVLALIGVGVVLVLGMLALVSLPGQRFDHIVLVILRKSPTHSSQSMSLYRTSPITLASSNSNSTNLVRTSNAIIWL